MSGKMTWSDAKLDIFSGTQNKYFKGVIGYKTHFYMLLNIKCCVGSVCTQPPYNDKNPPSGIFLSL